MHGVDRLMLRRVLVLTVTAVGLSAAGALAFAPGFSRVGHAWSRGSIWSGRGFTPVPVARDPHALNNDASFQSEGGVPGTYCPIRRHDPNAGVAVTGDQRMSTEPPITSSAATSLSGKTDLLAAPAMCNISATDSTRATPAQPPILP
jgi:hypothetical protein